MACLGIGPTACSPEWFISVRTIVTISYTVVIARHVYLSVTLPVSYRVFVTEVKLRTTRSSMLVVVSTFVFTLVPIVLVPALVPVSLTLP